MASIRKSSANRHRLHSLAVLPIRYCSQSTIPGIVTRAAKEGRIKKVKVGKKIGLEAEIANIMLATDWAVVRLPWTLGACLESAPRYMPK